MRAIKHRHDASYAYISTSFWAVLPHLSLLITLASKMSPPTTIKLAVLDDYQNLGQQFFSAIQGVEVSSFPETLNPRNDGDLRKLVERLADFDAISTMRERTPFQAPLLRQLPKLRLLLTTGLRNASIDLPTCTELGIQVVGTDPRHNLTVSKPKYPRPDSTTTHCWALILGIARHVARDDRLIKEGGWQGPTLASGVSGKVLGLAGLGRLGTSVGRIAVQAWGMRIIAWSTNLTQDKADEQAKSVGLEPGDFEVVSKERLFADADIVSIQLVLSERSKGIVGSADLQRMKKSALFVNTSRGPLVDEAALFDLCDKGSIAGAALDVFEQEPLAKDSKWRSTKWGQDGRAEVLLSPHMGYGETESVTNWYQENAETLGKWLQGGELRAKLNSL
jgi:lactate dehydrogenase-like 2-hydroxyacid dehydrogenase